MDGTAWGRLAGPAAGTNCIRTSTRRRLRRGSRWPAAFATGPCYSPYFRELQRSVALAAGWWFGRAVTGSSSARLAARCPHWHLPDRV